MDFKITAIQKPTYTHFIIEGENTSENTLRYLREIYTECTAHNYRYILIEERLEGKLLGTVDIFDIMTRASQKGLGLFKAIAFVDLSARDNDLKFIEDLAINRSLPVHSFTKVEEAEKWLTSKIITK